jgi:hypothetical protein
VERGGQARLPGVLPQALDQRVERGPAARARCTGFRAWWLTAVLGREPHTPLDEAVEATLVGLGCFAEPGGSKTGAAEAVA